MNKVCQAWLLMSHPHARISKQASWNAVVGFTTRKCWETPCIHTCIHACIHTYIHKYTHAYIHVGPTAPLGTAAIVCILGLRCAGWSHPPILSLVLCTLCPGYIQGYSKAPLNGHAHSCFLYCHPLADLCISHSKA